MHAALYAVLTVLLTYPLSVAAWRTLPADDPDGHYFMWALSWSAHALLHQPLAIFDANIFYPNRYTLAYSDNLIGSAFFSAPVIWLTDNPVLAVNVVSLLSSMLCGLGGYVLGRRVGLSASCRRPSRAHLHVCAAVLLSLQSNSTHGGPVDSADARVTARLLSTTAKSAISG